jgi:hypothetical protein
VADREGVHAGLSEQGDTAMADLVAEHLKRFAI